MMGNEFLQYKAGRIFLSQLPSGEDIIRSLEDFCRENVVKLAVFSVIGAVSLCTIGIFDQKQHVHVTSRKDTPMEIITCTGNITLHEDYPYVQAQIILADQLGKISGGRLFSDTLLFAGELQLMELLGPPANRKYDRNTGRMLWVTKQLKQ